MTETTNTSTKVILKCVKVAGKLRIRIASPGYLNTANCQFPRKLRKEGFTYTVNANQIKLVTSRARNFYRVTYNEINEGPGGLSLANIKIYDDKDEPDCAICLCEPKKMVFMPCGHFYVCQTCAKSLKLCPICRAPIVAQIEKEQIQ
jgi:hypothetical protein